MGVNKLTRSCFGSASHSRDVSLRVEHVLEEVPPPFDKQKVLTSIASLKKKVTALEENCAQDEITLQLQNRISGGRERQKKSHRVHNTLGPTDGGSERGDEMGSSQRTLIVKKNRLSSPRDQIKQLLIPA